MYSNTKCKYCNAAIVWTVTASGKYLPVDPTGFAACAGYDNNGTPYFRGNRHVKHSCGRTERAERASANKTKPAPEKPLRIKTTADALTEIHLLPGAPSEVVAAVLRVLTLLHHPDKGGSHEAMVRLNQAREILLSK